MIKNDKKLKVAQNDLKHILSKKKFLPLKGQGLSLWKACSLQRLSPRGHFGLKIQKNFFWSEMAWNVFKIDSSKIGFYQNFLIYCDKFDNKIIYCLSRFPAGNFSPAPTSNRAGMGLVPPLHCRWRYEQACFSKIFQRFQLNWSWRQKRECWGKKTVRSF